MNSGCERACRTRKTKNTANPIAWKSNTASKPAALVAQPGIGSQGMQRQILWPFRQLDFVNMDYFNPQPTSPDATTHNYTGTLGDHLTLYGGVLETMTQIRIATLKTYGIEARLKQTISDPAQIEAAIRDEAVRWAEGFDANSLIILAKALRGFDVTQQFDRIKAKVLFVLSRTDKLFPPEIAPGVMQGLKAAGVDADYFLLDSELGHSASGLDAHKWAPRLRLFMESL